MSRLSVCLFGAPRIELDGTAIETDTRKATALLAYLAVTEQPQRRATLAALFWPETDDARARAALRRTLSVLRSALGDRWLEVRGETIELDRDDLRVDVGDFRRAIQEGRFEEAVALYRGDFLAGFSLRDSPQFDDWQAAQTEALRGELASALARLVSAAERAGKLDRAIAFAKRILALDQLHEPAHRELMRLYARTGDRSAALRQYHECVRLLDGELGVAPLAETRALHEAIEAGTLPQPEPTVAVATAEAVGDVHTLHGDYRRAIEMYEAAMAKAPPAARASIEYKLAAVHHRRGDLARAEAHYRAALDTEADEGRRARIVADWSLAVHRRGDRDRAARLGREALELAHRAHDDLALAQAHNILGILTADRSQLEASLTLADRIGDTRVRVAALNNLALVLGRSGEVERAISLTREALAASAAIGDRHREAALHNNLADLLHRAGRREESMRSLKRAVRLFAEIGGPGGMEPEVWKLIEW